MAEVTLTDENFKTEVEDFNGIVLVDFWAEWCTPCRQQGPIIEQLAEELAGDSSVKIAKMDVDAQPHTPQQFGIRSIPTLKFFKNGQVVAELVGVNQKEVLKQAIESLK